MRPEVFALIERAATLVLADGPDGADLVPAALATDGRLADRTVVVGWLAGERPWAAQLAGARAVMGGARLRDGIGAGRIGFVPVRLSAVPRFLASLPRPIVTVLRGRPEGDGFVCGPSVGWAPAAAALADAVIVEVVPDAPPLAAPPIRGNVGAVVEGESTRLVPDWPEPDTVDRAIAVNFERVLPDTPTVQYGPSALLDTLVRAVDRPAAIVSGLVTDAVAVLARDGLLRAPAVTGYLWGSGALDDLVRDGRLRLAALDETHDVARLAAIPRFVACNTALQVGLDGAVNVETVRTRAGDDVVGGIGGHPDFARGASACIDGLSVIALRASHRGRSNVVAPAELTTVTTARTEVDVVVTEHGVADLRGRSDAERARLLRDIAPDGARWEDG